MQAEDEIAADGMVIALVGRCPVDDVNGRPRRVGMEFARPRVIRRDPAVISTSSASALKRPADATAQGLLGGVFCRRHKAHHVADLSVGMIHEGRRRSPGRTLFRRPLG